MNRDDVKRFQTKLEEKNFECRVSIFLQDWTMRSWKWLEILRGQENRKSEFLMGSWTLFLFENWNLKEIGILRLKCRRLKIARSMEILKWKISGKKLRDICIEFRCYFFALASWKNILSKFENSLLIITSNVEIPSLAFSNELSNQKLKLKLKYTTIWMTDQLGHVYDQYDRP